MGVGSAEKEDGVSEGGDGAGARNEMRRKCWRADEEPWGRSAEGRGGDKDERDVPSICTPSCCAFFPFTVAVTLARLSPSVMHWFSLSLLPLSSPARPLFFVVRGVSPSCAPIVYVVLCPACAMPYACVSRLSFVASAMFLILFSPRFSLLYTAL
jgi:hypothetical protein